MLNMGFLDDIKIILDCTNDDKNMLMFSATMPRQILNIAEKFMKKYEMIKSESKNVAIDLTDQYYFDVRGNDRYEVIHRIMAMNDNFYGIIFCKTRAEVDILAHKLINDKYASAALHGDIPQGQREKILLQFRNKNITVLVATDVAARGIDINDLTHVINYSLPQSPEIYVHRIGRTGRAGKKGTAITFVMPSEKRQLQFIERIINQRLEKREVPSIKDVIETRKTHIFGVIQKIVDANKESEYDSIAEKMLVDHDAKKIVTAVLRFAFQNELNSNSYKKLHPVPEYSGSRDRSRSRGSYGRDGRSSSYRGGRSDSRSGRSGGRSGDRSRSGSSGYRGDRSSSSSSSSGRSDSRSGRSSDRSGDRSRSGSSSYRGDRSSSSSGRSSSYSGGRSRSSGSRDGGRLGGGRSDGRSGGRSSSSSRSNSRN